MGLGKTVQTLAHFLLEREAKRANAPNLVICPTSVLPNWLNEAKRLAPCLNVVALRGASRRKTFSEIAKADVVVTTYALLARDAEVLCAKKWYCVVLDESQSIKNSQTSAAKATYALKAHHRLCLTGTPVENHLGELWSQFAFLLPGLLGTSTVFAKAFRTPIEKNGDEQRQRLLSARVRPFILRRTKSNVASELPSKEIIISRVMLEDRQRDLYESIRLAMHEKIQKEIGQKGWSGSRFQVLNALLKLRQVCCDPELAKFDSVASEGVGSAKLQALMEMLDSLVKDGRRILVFSQFTSMLNIIKRELATAQLDFVELNGSTKDRETPVTRFQTGFVPIFLISLKAGGTGLNLTAADTVIHYDPWWNPAAEDQAIDRAHRIGQTKNLFVYKLIAEGTVEERMLELQARKRKLAATIFDASGAADPLIERVDSVSTEFSEEDLNLLLQPLA
jgi:SNF2 family DNA or RNA helicase